jgi:hypothetical protein
MCDKKIQKEEFFFYEPGGPEFSLYVNGDDECEDCPHRTVQWEYISEHIPSKTENYGCRGLREFRAKSIELRINGRT